MRFFKDLIRFLLVAIKWFPFMIIFSFLFVMSMFFLTFWIVENFEVAGKILEYMIDAFIYYIK